MKSEPTITGPAFTPPPRGGEAAPAPVLTAPTSEPLSAEQAIAPPVFNLGGAIRMDDPRAVRGEVPLKPSGAIKGKPTAAGNFLSATEPFVTSDELKELEGFDFVLADFDTQVALLSHPLAEARRDQARLAYVANPTHEAFVEYRTASIDEALLDILPGHVLLTVEQARQTFLEKEAAAWAAAILKRALSGANSRLEEVIRTETIRHKELTGEPLTNSGIVDAARRPVTELQRLLDVALRPMSAGSLRGSVLAFFRANAAA